MLDRLRPRLNHATVVAYLALFVALGGVSYGVATGSIDSREVKNNSVRSKDLRNNDVRGTDIRTGTLKSSDVGDDSLTGVDVDESSLGTVPRAAIADSAGNASSAENAAALDGIDSTGFLRNTPPEAFRELGAPGQPTLQGTWANESPANETTAAFFIDPFGIVHLKGIVTGGGNGQLIFTLPAGYRPTKNVVLAGIRNADIAQVSVGSNGEVRQSSGGAVGGLSLDGLTFRAGAG